MEPDLRILRGLPRPVGGVAACRHLDWELRSVFADAYPTAGGKLSTVTLGGDPGEHGAFSYMFDEQPVGSAIDGRVVAAWGVSRAEPAATRDKGRMAGLLKGVWSALHPGRDRGHFFAHTMGGEMDINLFPQLASVNRVGEWRRMEEYAASHPGTFCSIRPIYRTTTWTPSELEYCIFKLPPADAPGLWFRVFPN